MAMLLQCDNCAVTTTDTRAEWLVLKRRSEMSLSLTLGGSQPDPDPVLGRGGLVFHDYDCLRLWLIANEGAT